MPQRLPFLRPPVVLLATASGTWLDRALISVLQPRGYRVESVHGGRELLNRAPALQPDVVVMDSDLPDMDSVAVCRSLREGRAAWDLPVVMVTSTPATKQQRLAALESGAWDYLSVLLSPEELMLKLDAMARLKVELDHTLQLGAVDPASGLYTRRGLERRARELTSDAVRRHAPLACLALGIELEPAAGVALSAERLPKAVQYAAELLQSRGRVSDAIGGLNHAEFSVLAPATPPEGAVKMAERLSQIIESAKPRPAGVPPLRVRAGYEAIRDLHATPLEPPRLLEHASIALHQAIAAGSEERIRAYRA